MKPSFATDRSTLRMAIVILALIATAIWHWWAGNWR